MIRNLRLVSGSAVCSPHGPARRAPGSRPGTATPSCPVPGSPEARQLHVLCAVCLVLGHCGRGGAERRGEPGSAGQGELRGALPALVAAEAPGHPQQGRGGSSLLVPYSPQALGAEKPPGSSLSCSVVGPGSPGTFCSWGQGKPPPVGQRGPGVSGQAQGQGSCLQDPERGSPQSWGDPIGGKS